MDKKIQSNNSKPQLKEIPVKKESNLEKALRLGNDEAIAKAIRKLLIKDEQ